MPLRSVYFQHLQKTGGTSITDALRLFFREERTCTQDKHLAGQRSITEALTTLRNFQLVTSHSDILSAAPDDAFTFSILRDPFERLLSARRQIWQATDEQIAAARPAVAAAILAVRHLPFDEVLHRLFEHPRLVEALWNHQTLMLGGWPLVRETSHLQACWAYMHSCLDLHFQTAADLHGWLDQNRSNIITRAKTSLRRLGFIGLMEEFDASAREVFARIGLPEPGEVLVRNARASFPDEDEPEIRSAAASFLDLDYELYEIGKELYARQRRAARGMPVDYTGRHVAAARQTIVSCLEPPAGHGWYLAQQRQDGGWSRLTGPALESRFSLAADPGSYQLTIELYGGVSVRSIFEAEILVEGRNYLVVSESLPTGYYRLSTSFARQNSDRFDVVVRCPDVGQEYGLAVKQFTFEPLLGPSAQV